MDDVKARKLREKLGISATGQNEAGGKAIGANVRNKIAGYSESGGNFVSAPGSGGNFVSAPGSGGNFVSAPGSGGNFVSAASVTESSVAENRPGTGGNFVSAP